MSTEKIYFITGNESKIAEAKSITGLDLIAEDLEIPEIQSLDVEEVAREKALKAFEKIGQPVIVDDTGMSIEALNGLPGALITWFLGALEPEGIIKILAKEKNRKASVSTCIAYADKTSVKTFVGIVQGEIDTSPRGSNGFGYDPIFIPEGYKKTYAEMSSKEKNETSMRKIALMKFKKFILNKK